MLKHLESETVFFAGFVALVIGGLVLLSVRDSSVNPHYEEFVRPAQSTVV